MLNKHIAGILDILQKTYPGSKIALNYKNNWELLVSVILSAQCTDVMVNKVTEKLFKKYPFLNDYVQADISQFENDIKKTGFFRNKAKNILLNAVIISSEYRGRIPDNMKDMLKLKGVARKTANVVLGNAYGIVEGIAVDTHVLRIAQRLRLVDAEKLRGKEIRKAVTLSGEILDFRKNADPEEIEKELMKNIPEKHWFDITYRIIDHGRSICKAVNPECGICPLKKYCPVSRV